MAQTATTQRTGKVVQVIGPVIDIEFADGRVAAIAQSAAAAPKPKARKRRVPDASGNQGQLF